MSVSQLNHDILRKLFKQRFDSTETQQWAGEVQIQTSRIRETRLVLVTEVGFYIFTKARTKLTYEREKVESIFNLVNCTVFQDRITIKFRTQEWTLETNQSTALRTVLLKQYRYITWNVNVTVFDGLNEIPGTNSMPASQTRPPHILLHRYIAASIAKNIEVDPKIVQMFKTFDAEPKKTIIFQPTTIQSAVSVFYPLAMEPNLREIVFDNFSPQNFGTVLNEVLTKANKLSRIILRNYTQAVLAGLLPQRHPDSLMSTIAFVNCSSNFVQQFFQIIRSAIYSIDYLIFDQLTFSYALCDEFLACLKSFPFASQLESLAFIDFQCALPILDFFKQVLTFARSLKQLVIEHSRVDISRVMSIVNDYHGTLQSLALRRNNGRAPFDSIPNSLLHLDLGDCEWPSHLLTQFLIVLCRSPRLHPFSLKLDHSHLNSSWSDSLIRLPIQSLQPVITELDLSHNHFDPNSFAVLLEFLGSQSPENRNAHKLLYLSLSNCVYEGIEQCLQALIEFWSGRELWGLAISDTIDEAHAGLMDDLIGSLNQIQGLASLDLAGNYLQESAILGLLQFLANSTSIAEISYDRSGINDFNRICYVYKALVKSDHVIGMRSPIEDLKSIGKHAVSQKIQNRLTKKRSFSSSSQRLALYLTLFGDQKTRVVPSNNEEQDPLFEVKFRNPIRRRELKNQRNEGNPLAVLVTESMKTVGLGILPPTISPPELLPTSPFQLPAIYGTMEAVHETVQYEDVDLVAIGQQLAETLQTFGGQVTSIFGEQHLEDPKEVALVPIVGFSP